MAFGPRRTPGTSSETFERLLTDATGRRLTRRQVLQKALALGLSAPVIMALLAACGGDDDDTTPTSGATTPTTAAAPSATSAAAAPSSTSAAGGATSPTAAAAGETPTLQEFATISPPTATLTGSAKGGGTLTLIFQGDMPDLDPQSSYDSQASAVYFGTYEMLARLKGSDTLAYQPMLATKWESSEDKTEWTFTIPAGVKFHDGTDCDADAVVKSFQRFYHIGLGPSPDIQHFIDNPDTDITAVDAQTVKFKSNVGSEIFLAMLTSQYGPLVVSPAAMEAHKTADDPWAHEWFKENPVGTGPYKFKEYVRGDHLTIEKFDDFHGGWDGPHFDEIVFRIVSENSTRRELIESGDGDALTQSLTPGDVQAIEEEGKLEVLRYSSTNALWVWMNYVRLSDVNVRTALCYAYPYEDVRHGVYDDLVIKSSGPLTPNTLGYDPNGYIFETDLDKAKQILTDANFDFGTELEYWIDNSSEAAKSAVQLFQSNLSQIGVNLNIVQKDYGSMIDFTYGEMPGEERPHMWDIGGGGWWPDYNDGVNEIFPNFYSKSQQTAAGPNQEFYANARVDEILDTVQAGVSADDYKTLLAEANNILVQKDPAAIFYGSNQWYTVKQKNLKGFISNPIYIGTYNLYEMYREEG